MHHYPFHPGDYLKTTAHWSEDRTVVECERGLLRDLAYRRLLDLYYGEEEPIPAKTKSVAIRIRMLKHEDVVALVLKEKFTLEDGFWRQSRADKEVTKYQKRVDIARENGKKGGRPSKPKPTGNPAGSELVTTRTRTRTIGSPLPPHGVNGFETFWGQYPKKADKPAAARAYAKAVGMMPRHKARATPEEIITGLAVHLTCRQWTKDGGEFVPNGATWLNADGWNDRPLQADPADDPAACWWMSKPGLLAKGLELQVPAPADESPHAFRQFKAAVWVEAGDGPWWDEHDTAYALAVQIRNGER